jgi:hypothetical protein
MSNGRESMMTPEQQLKEDARREQYQNNMSDEQRQREKTRDAHLAATFLRPRPSPFLPTPLVQQRLPPPPRLPSDSLEEQWLADHPTFTKNNGQTTIPGGSTIAILGNDVNNQIETVQTTFDLFFPLFYMGKKIVGVQRTGGRRSRKPRSRKPRSRKPRSRKRF